MKVEFLCRFEKRRSEEDIAQERINVELGLPTTPYEKEYEYDVLIQESTNIIAFNPVNPKHVALRTKIGEIFVIKGNIQDIMNKWTEITGEVITKCY